MCRSVDIAQVGSSFISSDQLQSKIEEPLEITAKTWKADIKVGPSLPFIHIRYNTSARLDIFMSTCRMWWNGNDRNYTVSLRESKQNDRNYAVSAAYAVCCRSVNNLEHSPEFGRCLWRQNCLGPVTTAGAGCPKPACLDHDVTAEDSPDAVSTLDRNFSCVDYKGNHRNQGVLGISHLVTPANK